MKKLLSAILILTLSLMLLIPFGVITASADEATLIKTQAELANLSAAGNYKLANDITISGEWNNTVEFTGVFDGDGHTITFANGAVINGGLFRTLRDGATVKNLKVVQAGSATWKITSETGSGSASIGGLVSSVEAGNGQYNNIGVITGVANRVTIRNVHVTADISNISGSSDKVAIGGIVGDLGIISLIDNCSFTGTINDSANRTKKDMEYKETGCGGIVGVAVRNCGPIAITGCVNNANITGSGQAGGILAYCRAWGGGDTGPTALIIERCVNNGKIFSSEKEITAAAGGIAGYVFGKDNTTATFKHNVNNGSVNKPEESAANRVAGIVGLLRRGTDGSFKFIGNVQQSDSVGGSPIYGYPNGHGEIVFENNYGIAGEGNATFTALTDASSFNSAYATLNAAYPGVFELKDGKIALAAQDSSGSGSIALNVPQTMTMNVTVPEATGTAIKSQEDLAAMKSDGTYYLANDIAITGSFKGISEFTGVLHGNGHTIVVNGCELRGGIIKELKGGKIYNLSVVDAPNAKNTQRGISSVNEVDLCFGTVVANGYGTIVNVAVDCAVGSSLLKTSNAFVGGVIGIVTDGETVIYNCYNIGHVQGANAGGIVGEVCCENGKVEISRSVNWGKVTTSSGTAGGIIGIHSLSSQEIAMNLLVLENVNYGAVSTTDSSYAGGIAGSAQSFWDGKAAILCNVNYGEIKANAEGVGCPGGIIGYIGYLGMIISGNVNVGSVEGTKTPNRLAALVDSNDGIVAENNVASASATPATIGTVAGADIDGDTLATLNAAYANTFVDGIALKWVTDAGLSATAPEVTYTVDLSNGQQDNKDNNNTNPGTTEPETQAPAAQTETKKGGCGSAIGIGGLVAMLMLGGAGAIVVTKRKED